VVAVTRAANRTTVSGKLTDNETRGKAYTKSGAQMRGRRRRDDGWDEDRRDSQDGWGESQADGGPGDWADRGRGDRPQARYPGGAYGDGAYGDGAYGVQAPGAGRGFRGGSDYPGQDYPAAGDGYDASGYDAPGYGGPGHNGSGHVAPGYNGPGYNGSAYNGSAYDGPGYGGRADGAPGYGAGYGGAPARESRRADWGQVTGYQGSGYGQGGYDGAGYGAADARAPRPSFQPIAGGGAAGRSDGEYPGYPAVPQPGRSAAAEGPEPAAGEFAAADAPAAANAGTPGTPRPYGRLSIFTLLDDKADEFDRLAERAAEGVRAAEPDTLVYVIHVVPKAPMQRIIYEVYRDRAAFEAHERQPHIQQFAADRRSCVLATNVIDLRLKYAKVAALGSAQPPQAPAQSSREARATRTPRALEPANGQNHAYPAADGDRYANGANGYASGRGYPAPAGQHQGNGRHPELGSGRQQAGQYAESGAGYPGAAEYPGYAGYSEGRQFSDPGYDGYPGQDDRSPRPQSPDWSPSYYGER
jgi:quinol monooxygenase YgiN